MSRFVILGDLGGTNIRLEVVDATVPSSLPREDALHSARFRTQDFTSFEEALRTFASGLPDDIASSLWGAALAVCGPVVDGGAVCLAPIMGKGGWNPTNASIAEALGVPCAYMVNDFVAVGLALPAAAARSELVDLYTPPAPFVRPATTPGSTVAVLGPGTGLGECFGVYRESGELAVFPSEGGGADYAPRTDEEWALRNWIARQANPPLQRVEIEKICSGEGLLNVYGYLLSTAVAEPRQVRTTPSTIVEGSRTGDDVCVRAMDLWLAALGSEAGSLAIRFQARGGVYIAGGGVCSKIAAEIADGRLRAAYLRCARLLALHAHCPLYLLPADGDKLGLDGTLAFARTKFASNSDLCRVPTAEEAASRVAELVLAELRATPDLVLCVASGATPTRCYAILAAAAERDPACFTRLRVVQLDEWRGLGEGDGESCVRYIREHVVGPLRVGPERFLSFDGQAVDGEAECARVRGVLKSWGGVGFSVLGLGQNGHLGFNEPGSESDNGNPEFRTAFVASLSPESQGHQMVAGRDAPTEGLTLGLAELCAARRSVVMVTGTHKAAVLRAALRDRVSARRPASLLRRFGRSTLFVCDEAAAAEL